MVVSDAPEPSGRGEPNLGALFVEQSEFAVQRLSVAGSAVRERVGRTLRGGCGRSGYGAATGVTVWVTPWSRCSSLDDAMYVSTL